jgi:hypothetical protein
MYIVVKTHFLGEGGGVLVFLRWKEVIVFLTEQQVGRMQPVLVNCTALSGWETVADNATTKTVADNATTMCCRHNERSCTHRMKWYQYGYLERCGRTSR